eukprot:m.195756 g.195756  ORF g.195756 m.195756 type:complete len:1021 (-) comp19622_c0_seq1:32-3094(-)
MNSHHQHQASPMLPLEYRNMPVKFLGQRPHMSSGGDVSQGLDGGKECQDTIRWLSNMRSAKEHRHNKEKRVFLDVLPDEGEVVVRSRRKTGDIQIRIPMAQIAGVGIIGRKFALRQQSRGDRCDMIYAFETQRKGDDTALLSSLFGSVATLYGVVNQKDPTRISHPTLQSEYQPQVTSQTFEQLRYEAQYQRTLALEADRARLEAELRAMKLERECEVLRRERAEMQAELAAFKADVAHDVAQFQGNVNHDMSTEIHSEMQHLKDGVAAIASRFRSVSDSEGHAANDGPQGAAFWDEVYRISEHATTTTTTATAPKVPGGASHGVGSDSSLALRLTERLAQYVPNHTSSSFDRKQSALQSESSTDSGMVRSAFASRHDTEASTELDAVRPIRPHRASTGSARSTLGGQDVVGQPPREEPTSSAVTAGVSATTDTTFTTTEATIPESTVLPPADPHEAALSLDWSDEPTRRPYSKEPDENGNAQTLTRDSGTHPVRESPAAGGHDEPYSPTPIKHEEIVEVEIARNGQPLGIGIAGGTDTVLHDADASIFISSILHGCAAHATGQIHHGDRILKANGVDLEHVTHQEAVDAIRKGTDTVSLVLARVVGGSPNDITNYSTMSEQTTIVEDVLEIEFEHTTEGLGFLIQGGLDSRVVQGDNSIYVTRIVDSGAAHRDGRLHVDDRLIEVNGVSMVGVTHSEAVAALMLSLGTRVHMVVSRLPTQHEEIFTIDFPITENGLGFSVLGGSDQSNHQAYGDADSAILVNRVLVGGSAAADGRLQYGDRILEVNGHSFMGVTHESAVNVLSSIEGHVVLKIARVIDHRDLHDVFIDVIIRLPEVEEGVRRDLGFTIGGGREAPLNEGDPSFYITKLVEGGFAHRDGQLRFGDKLISINDVDVTCASHKEVIKAIKGAQDELRIRLARLPLENEDADDILQVHFSCRDQRLGMQICGGTDNPYGEDGGIYIDYISPDGAAASDGRLRAGDKLLICNGQGLTNVTSQEARECLLKNLHSLRLTISRKCA